MSEALSTARTRVNVDVFTRYAFAGDFNISKFIDYCALNGKIKLNGTNHTLLLSPMGGFYNEKSKGDKQARIALVEQESKMKIVPKIRSRLLANYLKSAIV